MVDGRAMTLQIAGRTGPVDLTAGPSSPVMEQVVCDGKHMQAGSEPFRVKGVTYGSFAPRDDGELFPEGHRLKDDLLRMAERGINVVRTYTLPPPELLDLAREVGLRVLVGLHYEDWRYEQVTSRAAHQRILDRARRALDVTVERCKGRPEVLGIAVGNEVPGDVVRAHGIGRVESGLSSLVAQVKDAGLLATYCNFPTTEFLQVEEQDFLCFNVFLENPEKFRGYLRRLQIVSGEKPLVLSELGLPSNIHGEDEQANFLEWQLRTVDELGIAGATVFSWTDEWAVNGDLVEGWDFGINDAERGAKPALDVVERWARSSVRELRSEWPRISAVVCVYNGEDLIGKCLTSLQGCDYPGLEVIVCDDGSTDATLEIARSFPFKILDLNHGGLSRARNAGMTEASGEIVAYIDADAFCHPDWPYHLALSLEDENVAATGGPNLRVPGGNIVEEAVSLSPGSPMEVLISDNRAEHVPGCNMAYKKERLEAIGGFNPIYTSAGDDVDVCWKLLDEGWEIAFAPAAQVHHHRRDTVKGYLKQQRGYGRAEALLEPHHRRRFNRLGQARWSGFVYGGARLLPRLLRPVVYHGYVGMAPFQPVARRRSETARNWGVALMPLLVLAIVLGAALTPVALPFLGVAAVALATLITFATAVALDVEAPPGAERQLLKLRSLVAFMHIAQPLVRTWGRIRTKAPEDAPVEYRWLGDRVSWINDLEKDLSHHGCWVHLGGVHDRWDLAAWRHSLVSWRVTTAVLWKWTPVARMRPRLRPLGWLLLAAAVLAASLIPSPFGISIAGVAAAGLAYEALAVRGLIQASIARTTEGEAGA
jgi:glycosyltransferase involved in cell wall biosynthesis